MNTTEQIWENGWAGPVRILSEEALEALRHHLKELDLRKDAAWSKDLAVRYRVIFDLAQHPTLLSVITPLLGENIVLWGAQVVQRTPGQAHAWHSDLEVWDARAEDAVSVWIGVEGTSDESSLHFISGTQTLGISVQEAGAHLERDQRTGEAMLELAHQHLPNVPFLFLESWPLTKEAFDALAAEAACRPNLHLLPALPDMRHRGQQRVLELEASITAHIKHLESIIT